MSFLCSCSCTQLGFAAGLQPATQGKINHTPYFPQTARIGEKGDTERARMRQTLPFLTLYNHKKIRKHDVPYFPLAHGQLNDKPTLNQFPFFLFLTS